MNQIQIVLSRVKLGGLADWHGVQLPRRIRTALDAGGFQSIEEVGSALMWQLLTRNQRRTSKDKPRAVLPGKVGRLWMIQHLWGSVYDTYCLRLAASIEDDYRRFAERNAAEKERASDTVAFQRSLDAYQREQEAFQRRTRAAQRKLHKKELERIERMARLYQTIVQREAAERAGCWPSRAVP